MLPLNEMLANAQNGQAFEQMARQFGLSQQQAQQAVEALLPAFSRGLKQNTADPYNVGAFLSALSSGQHAKYFDDASQAFTPDGMAEGNGILGHVFGSKELSRAVADQAAHATGIGQDVMKQMLPALAAMIMGGLFKQSTGQLGASPSGAASSRAAGAGTNPLGEILEQMMRQGMGGQAQQRRAPQPDMADNPFGKILQDMFGGAAQHEPQSRPQTQNPGDNPFGRIYEDMMRGAGAQSKPAPEPETASPRTNPSGRERTPYDDVFGDMFETGARQRDEYQKNMESVVDQFLKGMDRFRR
ncbi:DUF937 domain-containing protein [Mesorhizobium xinjiangense]|uniref:DUF937 domain-containing protein n=1 Tax=Mesorhizobium xinjiangense TaxID=2678685 RepID=UPI0012EE1C13|nr:DUF937 domain-containing protein [Mesorhizobium xinjiangense]